MGLGQSPSCLGHADVLGLSTGKTRRAKELAMDAARSKPQFASLAFSTSDGERPEDPVTQIESFLLQVRCQTYDFANKFMTHDVTIVTKLSSPWEC